MPSRPGFPQLNTTMYGLPECGFGGGWGFGRVGGGGERVERKGESNDRRGSSEKIDDDDEQRTGR